MMNFGFLGRGFGRLGAAGAGHGSSAPQNLFIESDFRTVGIDWFVFNATATPNSVAGPEGHTDAATLIEASDTNQYHSISQGIVKAASRITYTVSAYAKALGSGSTRDLELIVYNDAGTDGTVCTFKPADGTNFGHVAFGTGWTAVGQGSVSIGSGWWRFYITFTTDTDTGLNCDLALTDNTADDTYNGDGVSGLKIAHAQLDPSASLRAYVSTATAGAGSSAGEATGLLLSLTKAA